MKKAYEDRALSRLIYRVEYHLPIISAWWRALGFRVRGFCKCPKYILCDSEAVLIPRNAPSTFFILEFTDHRFENHLGYFGAFHVKHGCSLEYDLFGTEHSYQPWSIPVDMPNDGQRLRWLEWLIAEGYRDQIVISQDTFFKHQLTRYGGPGYAHIPVNVVPYMRTMGFDADTIRAILTDNPARLLAFAETS